MKSKPTVTYIKDKKTVTKDLNFITREGLSRTLFKQPYNVGPSEWDYYKLNDNITYLHFKNVTFYRESRFICPPNTILILENCSCRKQRFLFAGGKVKIINPNLSCAWYRNLIVGLDLDEFYLSSKNNSPSFLTLNIDAKNIEIDGEPRIDQLYLTGDKIKLENIYKLTGLSIKGNCVKIKNSNIDLIKKDSLEPQDKTHIITNILDLENTKILTFKINYQSLIIDNTVRIESQNENYKSLSPDQNIKKRTKIKENITT